LELSALVQLAVQLVVGVVQLVLVLTFALLPIRLKLILP
jgi:hypothetical protein